MTADLDNRRRRARFRSRHRGTKEMDWILGRFADARLPDMAAGELELFEQLLGQPDPEIQAWVVDCATPVDGAFADLVAQLRQFHKLDQSPV